MKLVVFLLIFGLIDCCWSRSMWKAEEKVGVGKAGEKADADYNAWEKADTGKADEKTNTDSRKEIGYKWRYRYYSTTSRPWTWRRYYFTTSRPWLWHRHHHEDDRNLYDDIRNYQDDQQDTSIFAIIFLSCLLVVFAAVILFISRKKITRMVTGRRGSETMNPQTQAVNADEARPLMKNYVA